MRHPRSWITRAIVVVACSMLLVACTSDSDDPTATATPSTTATDTSTATATPGTGMDAPTLNLELVASGLTAPSHMATPDDGTGRLFVLEQTGTVRIITADGTLVATPFLDVSDRMVELNPNYDERGLLGIAFHPAYADNGRFFVYYSAPLQDGAPAGWDHTSVLAEFAVSDDPDLADPDSERVVMLVDQPQFNHNAGHIVFGPDGYLYVPLGDGGAANDKADGHTPEIGNAQDRSNILGSILRIDVDSEGDGELAYAIPSDNPFVDAGADVRPETWAYGVRNPFDISFDPNNEYGLFIADAGQDLYEWVQLAKSGDNLGWNILEGSHCFDPDDAKNEPADCARVGAGGEPLVLPIVEWARADFGTVTTGVRFYRGANLEGYQGHLFVVDWNAADTGDTANGALLVATPGATSVTGEDDQWEYERVTLVLDGRVLDEGEGLGLFFTTLGSDADGEVYVLTNSTATTTPGAGAVYRLAPAPAN